MPNAAVTQAAQISLWEEFSKKEFKKKHEQICPYYSHDGKSSKGSEAQLESAQ